MATQEELLAEIKQRYQSGKIDRATAIRFVEKAKQYGGGGAVAAPPAPSAAENWLAPAPYPKLGEASLGRDTVNVLGNAAKDVVGMARDAYHDPIGAAGSLGKLAVGAWNAGSGGMLKIPGQGEAEETFSQTFSAPSKEQLYEHPLRPAFAVGAVGGAFEGGGAIGKTIKPKGVATKTMQPGVTPAEAMRTVSESNAGRVTNPVMGVREAVGGKVLQKGAEKLYRKTVPWGTTEEAAKIAKNTVPTLIDNKFMGTEGGMQRKAARVNELIDTQTAVIKAAKGEGADIALSDYTEPLRKLKEEVSHGVDHNTAPQIVQSIIDRIESHPDVKNGRIPLDVAQRLKKEHYASAERMFQKGVDLTGHYEGQAEVTASLGLKNAIEKATEGALPETISTVKNINAELGDLIASQKGTTRAYMRSAGGRIMPTSLSSALHVPEVGQALAIGLDRLGGGKGPQKLVKPAGKLNLPTLSDVKTYEATEAAKAAEPARAAAEQQRWAEEKALAQAQGKKAAEANAAGVSRLAKEREGMRGPVTVEQQRAAAEQQRWAEEKALAQAQGKKAAEANAAGVSRLAKERERLLSESAPSREALIAEARAAGLGPDIAKRTTAEIQDAIRRVRTQERDPATAPPQPLRPKKPKP